ncbi:hypothetical protein [Thermomonas sp.]|uniref:hypothetical protein n=1 Tax=Thermomonas sp. TaxID=1971895 RepID=UPI0024878230|nr:hypothetical protein [Thermomonas sp.]MDI1253660.1 hypothetical protein [Thermomonas sp.]
MKNSTKILTTTASAGAALLLMTISTWVLAQPQRVPQAVDATAASQTDKNVPLVPNQPTWDSFHGQLNAQITAISIKSPQKMSAI